MKKARVPNVAPAAYSVNETCKILRCSRRKVYDLLAESRLKSFKLGRARRITRRSVDELLAACEEEVEAVA